MSPQPHPPRIARALAHTLLRGDAREIIVGDLDQEFAEALAAGTTLRSARRMYWRQTLASIAAVRSQRLREMDDMSLQPYRPLRGLSLDVRAVFRSLRRSPGYAVVAILSLAIGIGANTAMFSVMHQLLVTPLAVERPDELRLAYWKGATDGPFSFGQINSTGYRDPSGVFYRSNYSYPEFLAIKNAVGGTARLAGYNRVSSLTISPSSGASITGAGMLVSGNFFDTLRPLVAHGRGLVERDDVPGAPAVAVIGHGLLMRAFGGDPAIVGQTVRVNGVPVEIVGITGSRYRGLSPGGFAPDPDITVALATQPQLVPEWTEAGTSLFTDRNQKWIRIVVRTDAASEGQATGAITAAARTAMDGAGMTPDQAAGVTPRLFPAPRGTDSLRTTTQPPLRILSTVLAIVLVIACVNVAGLMLARGVARQREIAVRRALGASRGRVMRELLVESILLSGAGSLGGVLLALWTAPVTGTILTAGLGATEITVQPDWRVLAAATVFGCIAAILTGLLPAIRFSGRKGTMLQSRGASAGAPRLRAGRVLLVLQIAVSLPLVTGAGLFLRTLHNFGRVDLGFDPQGLVLFKLDPTMSGKSPERVATVFPRVLEALRAVSGVTSATLVENALISGFESDSTATIGDNKVNVYMQWVGPGYLDTMSVPLLSGRPVGDNDRGRGPAAVVINELAATKYFGSPSPIGQHFRIGRRDVEVVGVAKDTRYDALRNDTPPTVLWSYLQRPVGGMFVIVRSSVPAATLRRGIEDAVRSVDPSLPISGFKTQTEQIDETIGRERVFARLLTVFGAFALILACIGLHGVTSYSVARRTSEIGVRLALGAQRTQVLWLVLRQVVGLAIIGLCIGLPIAWMIAPTVRAFLFGIEPTDAMTLTISAALMFAVAIAAGLIPARRASRLHAITAIRTE